MPIAIIHEKNKKNFCNLCNLLRGFPRHLWSLVNTTWKFWPKMPLRGGHRTLGVLSDSTKSISQYTKKYELDCFVFCRTMWSRFHILSGTCQKRLRNRMVGMDGRLLSLHYPQHDLIGKSHTDAADRNSLPRMDRHRSRRNGTHRHLHLPRANHFLATIFHHYTYNIIVGLKALS